MGRARVTSIVAVGTERGEFVEVRGTVVAVHPRQRRLRDIELSDPTGTVMVCHERYDGPVETRVHGDHLAVSAIVDGLVAGDEIGVTGYLVIDPVSSEAHIRLESIRYLGVWHGIDVE